jgi:hypothetical protein
MRRISVCRHVRSERGQSLILFALLLPVLSGFAGLMLDAAHAFAEQRVVQNAADSAALAATQDVAPALDPSCDSGCLASVRTAVAATVSGYSADNGGASSLSQCVSVSQTNCYTWPYKGANGKVEVRLRNTVHGILSGILGFAPDFLKPAARAVAGRGSTSETHCVFNPPVTNPDQYLPDCVKPGQPGGGGQPAVLFAGSTDCDALVNISSGGNTFVGGVISNGGYKEGAGDSHGNLLQWGLGGSCLDINGGSTWTTKKDPSQWTHPLAWPLAPPTLTIPGVNKTVTNKVMTGGVATLTTSSAHTLAVGKSVAVNIGDARFDGTYTVSAVPNATTFSYTPTPFVSSVTTKAITGAVATLTTSSAHQLNANGTVTVAIGDPRFNQANATVTAVPSSTTFTYTPATIASSAWAWASGTRTASLTTASGHGVQVGDQIRVSGFGGPQNCLNRTTDTAVTAVTATTVSYVVPVGTSCSPGTSGNNASTITIRIVVSAVASGTATVTGVPSTAATGTVTVPGTTITAVTDAQGNTSPCTDVTGVWTTAPANLASGLYCLSSGTIKIQNIETNKVGFVAPQVTWSQGANNAASNANGLRGFDGVFPTYGGLLIYAYGTGTVDGGRNDLTSSGPSGDKWKGVIIAPSGRATIPSSQGTSALGFIEAWSITFPGSNASFTGLGPPFGGTPSTPDVAGTPTTTVTATNVTMDE